MSIKIFFAWYDFWIGFYYDRVNKALYFCPVPTSNKDNMAKKVVGLTKAGKEDLALALILLKDFKSEGKFDPKLSMDAWRMADYLGVSAQYDSLLAKIPPMRIEPR